MQKQLAYSWIAITITAYSCCGPLYLSEDHRGGKQGQSTSDYYRHFAGGVLFDSVRYGLDVLWMASFKGLRPYKETLGFFITDGLLIVPNQANTRRSAKLAALPLKVTANRLFVLFGGRYHEVFGIIHTHPDCFSLPGPAPRNDFQFCYLGIHNYVMNHKAVFDAYHDVNGRETFRRTTLNTLIRDNSKRFDRRQEQDPLIVKLESLMTNARDEP